MHNVDVQCADRVQTVKCKRKCTDNAQVANLLKADVDKRRGGTLAHGMAAVHIALPVGRHSEQVTNLVSGRYSYDWRCA